MSLYDYKAMDSKGKSSQGVIEADSTIEAINRIREMGLYPTSVTEKKKKAATAVRAKKPLFSFLGNRIKQKEYIAFMRQFATLVDAGLPILRSVRVLEDQQTNLYFKKVLDDVGGSIESGNSLSDSLRRFPNAFSELFINMVKAGEAGGVLDQVLLRMAVYYEKAAKLRRKVKSSMAYPAFVVAIAGGIVYFLLTFVVPKFKIMFDDMKVDLPGITTGLINVSTVLKDHILLVFGLIVVLFVLVKIFLNTEKGSYIFDKVVLRVPLAGSLVKKVAIARFSRTLGTLINSGVPILEALDITSKTVGNKIVSESIQLVNTHIKEGESMVTPLKHGGIFPPVVLSMISVGEETGKVSDMLMKVADAYDDEIDAAVSTITGMVEPVIIVTLAVGVGFIVIAMFLPLVEIIEKMST
ncbi:MAG: type II secretion system F family protein [Candidatus Aureabacteria bacterium]|nr:type II secretion system F family protein [Candidatus Auribacterota bacterium]